MAKTLENKNRIGHFPILQNGVLSFRVQNSKLTVENYLLIFNFMKILAQVTNNLKV
jgi:hypothetical protein